MLIIIREACYVFVKMSFAKGNMQKGVDTWTKGDLITNSERYHLFEQGKTTHRPFNMSTQKVRMIKSLQISISLVYTLQMSVRNHNKKFMAIYESQMWIQDYLQTWWGYTHKTITMYQRSTKFYFLFWKWHKANIYSGELNHHTDRNQKKIHCESSSWFRC